MAEALISVLLKQLAEVTYQHVGQEVKLVLNAEKDVKEFEAKLKAISAVLEDAELRQVKEASVRNWLEELTDVSYKMDNVLDEWNTEVLKQEVEKQEEHGGSTSFVTEKKMKAVCFSIPSSCFCFGQISWANHRREIARKIKSLNENLDGIAKQRETYNFRLSERTTSEQPKREKTSSFVDESIIFGREQQKEVLVSKLLNESSQEERRLLVIPIVGMGGMGKTTLAQLAFNDETVKACFQIKIWVCVSDPFDEIKIAKAIIEGVENKKPDLDELEAVLQRMSKSIKGKKFLLILDDVWTEDQGKWEKLKLPLIQSGAHGSRILMTTRKQEVAVMMGATTHTIHLERLSEQNCLSIFNRMAFYNRDKDGVLEAIGEEIAKKCKGLSLAAKTLGSLMRYKKTRKEWQEVLNNKIWELEEALISVLLEQLASVTYQHVGQEVKLVLNAEKDVEEFAANIEAIRAVLEDAEQRQVKEASVRNWLEKLKDVSYKMDNVLDEWKTEILKQQVEKQEEHGGSTSLVTDKKKRAVCFSIPSSCFCFGQVRRIILHRDIALKIKSLNENLDEIAKQRETYNFRFTERMISEQIEREKTSSFVDESIIFGREQQKEDLVSKLLKESSQEERGLLAIPIVGMGGMGKTTLAQLAFNDENVKAYFQIKIWVCVSDPFDEIKIAKAIISGAKGVGPNSNELEDFLQCMFESVKGKKFLLVLDDVWTEDQRKWEQLKLPLIQSGAHGSRILVTTRKQEVADMMGAPTHTIFLERLSEQNCLSIFNRMAFYNRDKDGVLEAIGEEIAKKCNGLPLATKTLGSLMRYKKTRKEWQEVLNSKIWELEEVEQQVFRPLLLSYFDLVPMVKRCLLYCAIFLKDHEIDKDHLIELWMSQDYLYSKGKIEKKTIGQRCFDNLVMRSFFQDFKKDVHGNIWMCKMHDIVHDFLQFLTQNECFTMEVKGGNDTIEALGDKIRHLTLMLAPEGPLSCVSFSSCDLRTLATFDSQFNVVDSTLISQLKHLRTLNLSGNCIEVLPEEIGELVHLRFIDLSNNNDLKRLPNAVCNLYNLQTLRLHECWKLESLPQSMGKLINLKHLYVEGCHELKYLPKGIGRLTNLRRLDWCRVGGGKDDDEAFKLGDLRNLDQLQGKLEIVIYGDVKVVAGEGEKASPMGNKQQLSHLTIHFHGCRTSAEILNFLRPHPNLESLSIKFYNGSSAPNWIMSLNNLRFLHLHEWNECEVLPPLGRLPSLETLRLEWMGVKKVGVEFLGIEKETSSASSCITLFPKLKELTFERMWAWEEWKEEDSHITIMPCLSSLQFRSCFQLKTLPDFLRKTPLQTLAIDGSPCLKRGCQKGSGKEWPKISHIPNINISPRLDSDFDDEGEGIVEAEDAVELPERPSTSDSDDEGEGVVEAEEAVWWHERPSTSDPPVV